MDKNLIPIASRPRFHILIITLFCVLFFIISVQIEDITFALVSLLLLITVIVLLLLPKHCILYNEKGFIIKSAFKKQEFLLFKDVSGASCYVVERVFRRTFFAVMLDNMQIGTLNLYIRKNGKPVKYVFKNIKYVETAVKSVEFLIKQKS